MNNINTEVMEKQNIEAVEVDTTTKLEEQLDYTFDNTKARLKEVMDIYEDDANSLAKYLGLSYQSLNKKLNGHVDFKRGEIKAISDRYHLNAEMIYFIFFEE